VRACAFARGRGTDDALDVATVRATVTAVPSVITIGIDPTIEIGPVALAWHGLMIAVGIVVGGVAVAHDARRRGLDPERVYVFGPILVVGALVGGRVFYLIEHEQLGDPGAWLGTVGFTFYGGFIAAALGIAFYLRRERLSLSYLDSIAAGLPLGLAVGRIRDVINGDHYGPATDFVLGVCSTHRDALTPNPDVAYHSGGLYEVLIGAIVFAIVWPLRTRLRRPLALMWLMLALFAVGRFFEFFLRSDSADLALGLEVAQWTSVALLAAAAAGAWLTLRRRPAPRGHPRATAGARAGLSSADWSSQRSSGRSRQLC
jgi:phosphatidylglycerol---prolipoprotein diacylglyceryl transferase